MTKWYRFDQNNSAGVFKEPAQSVFIEANNAKEANDILYSKLNLDHSYCECCGERWDFVDEEDGSLEEPVSIDKKWITTNHLDEAPAAVKVRLGTTVFEEVPLV